VQQKYFISAQNNYNAIVDGSIKTLYIFKYVLPHLAE
jgi:hypothetical protein